MCHNGPSALLLSEFGFGHILQHAPVSIILIALHLHHSYKPLGGASKLNFDTPPLIIYSQLS